MTQFYTSQDHSIVTSLCGELRFTGIVAEDVATFLCHHHHADTALHCQHVAAMARQVAVQNRHEIDPLHAEIAGWLHDVSAIFPVETRAQVAHTLGIEVLPEEESCPMIIHQKLSKRMAQDIFGITDSPILDAIGSHTTLRAKSTILDRILFVADKIAWDQPGTPPYIDELQTALSHSLDEATIFFLTYLWQHRDSLQVIHPWLRAAVLDLCGKE